MFSSRVSLDPKALGAVRALLSRSDGPYANHKLIWSLFPDVDPDGGERPFLYDIVDEAPLTAIIRSAVPPENALGCWNVETKPFAPVIAAGDRLMFRTKVVATRARNMGPDKRGKTQDVVMSEWWSVQPPERRAQVSYADVAPVAAYGWLTAQGRKHGFEVEADDIGVRGYETHKFAGRGRKEMQIQFGVLDLGGFLEVTDPVAFTKLLGTGFGRARGFGYGLLHIAQADTGERGAVV
jgi:CRISPR system Cascade subunit CasE